jgi:hypothetical protein
MLLHFEYPFRINNVDSRWWRNKGPRLIAKKSVILLFHNLSPMRDAHSSLIRAGLGGWICKSSNHTCNIPSALLWAKNATATTRMWTQNMSRRHQGCNRRGAGRRRRRGPSRRGTGRWRRRGPSRRGARQRAGRRRDGAGACQGCRGHWAARRGRQPRRDRRGRPRTRRRRGKHMRGRGCVISTQTKVMQRSTMIDMLGWR